jgi:hypothetical protein
MRKINKKGIILIIFLYKKKRVKLDLTGKAWIPS